MLAELTDAQKELIPQIRDKWINLTLTYQELKSEELMPHYKWLYEFCNYKVPKDVFVANGPKELQLVANFVKSLSNVDDDFEMKVKQYLQTNPWQTTKLKEYYQLWGDQLSSGSGWSAFYDYFLEIGVHHNEDFIKHKSLLEKGIFMSILFDKVVLVCTAPVKVSRRKDGVFHNENGPAYEFKNGEKYYVLNGVSVPEWLVMTHSDALDPNKVISIKNADQRAEGVRKLGIERLVKFGKVLDTYKNYNDEWFHKSQYELIDMSPIFTAIKYAPYLKMLNQSVPGVWHLEAVSKDCKTVQDAVDFRTKSKNPKIQIIK